MSFGKKLGIAVIVLVMISAIVLAIVYSKKSYYYQPMDLQQLTMRPDQGFKLGGQVQPGSVFTSKSREPKSRFVLMDRKNRIQVHYSGSLPRFLKEGKFIVVQGTLASDNTLQAVSVHDDYYFFYILAAYMFAVLVLALGLLFPLIGNHNTVNRLKISLGIGG